MRKKKAKNVAAKMKEEAEKERPGDAWFQSKEPKLIE